MTAPEAGDPRAKQPGEGVGAELFGEEGQAQTCGFTARRATKRRPPPRQRSRGVTRKLGRAEPAASGRRARAFATRKPPASTRLREVRTNPSPGSLAQVEEDFRGGVLLPECMSDPLAGHPAPKRVESRPQRGILPKCLQNAGPGDLPHVRKGRPRPCDRGGPG